MASTHSAATRPSRAAPSASPRSSCGTRLNKYRHENEHTFRSNPTQGSFTPQLCRIEPISTHACLNAVEAQVSELTHLHAKRIGHAATAPPGATRKQTFVTGWAQGIDHVVGEPEWNHLGRFERLACSASFEMRRVCKGSSRILTLTGAMTRHSGWAQCAVSHGYVPLLNRQLKSTCTHSPDVESSMMFSQCLGACRMSISLMQYL